MRPRTAAGWLPILIAALAVVLASTGTRAFAPPTLPETDPSWRLQSSSDSIQLYRGSIHGSGIVPVKAILSIPGTIEEVSLVLEDVPRRRQWMGDRTESTVLERPSDYEQTEYLRVNLPWPVSDRSALIRAEVDVSDDHRRATISARSVDTCPEDTLPRLVRARIHPSIFQMTQRRSRVEIVALVFVDPRAGIPRWVVNYFATRVARQTLAGLRRQVGRNLYSPAQRSAMHERILAYRRTELR